MSERLKRHAAEPVTAAVPPHDIMAEMSVLGSMLFGGNSAVAEADTLLSASDFVRQAHKTIFAAMLDIAQRGIEVDTITLKSDLEGRGLLDKVGGLSFVMQLGDVEFTTTSLPYYAAIVRDRAARRQLAEVAASVFHDAMNDGETDVSTLISSAQESLAQAASLGKNEDGFRTLKDVLAQSWDELDERFNRGDTLTGFPTGFTVIDRRTGGLQDGDLVVLAARPSMGKTAMLCNICMDAAKHHRRVAFFSLEMPEVQIANRMVCAAAKVDSHRHRTPSVLTPEELERLQEASALLWTSQVQIDATSGLTISQICNRARRLHAREPVELVMVDYLQQIASDDRDRKNENRTQEIAAMSRRLKALARELSCPVVLLSQLSRAVEKREDKRPMLSDLYESGGIEAAADIVMALYRPAYYAQKSEEEQTDAPEEAEVIFLKYRNGETGIVKLGFLAKYAQFFNIATNKY